MTDNAALRRAIEVGEDALTDAHANAPLPEVADWDALAEIVVKALIREGLLCQPDHLHFSIEFESDQFALPALSEGDTYRDASTGMEYRLTDGKWVRHSDGPKS